MSIDTIEIGGGQTGFEVMRAGILRFVGAGEMCVISRKDTENLIGTSALTDCAGFGICDPSNQVAGIVHVRFLGANPDTWWERFIDEANELINLANRNSGKSYTAHFENVNCGLRRLDENITLGEHAFSWARKKREIHSHIFSNASAFILNKLTGEIFT